MSPRRTPAARDRDLAGHRQLREASLAHLIQTLDVLMAFALTEASDDEHPKGWVIASRKWLAERTGVTTKTITAHMKGLIDANEIVVWSPQNRRSGRPREYLVTRLSNDKSARRAEMREYRRNSEMSASRSLARPSRGNHKGKPTTPLTPSNVLPADQVGSGEFDETFTPHGSVGEVDGSLLLRDGTRGHHDLDRFAPALSAPDREARLRSWSDVIASVTESSFQRQKTGSYRGQTVGLGRCLDRVANEQGLEEAGVVFGLAFTRSRDGESFCNALRGELKTALGLSGYRGEREFAATCGDTTIPMTVPLLAGCVSGAFHHDKKETGT